MKYRHDNIKTNNGVILVKAALDSCWKIWNRACLIKWFDKTEHITDKHTSAAVCWDSQDVYIGGYTHLFEYILIEISVVIYAINHKPDC